MKGWVARRSRDVVACWVLFGAAVAQAGGFHVSILGARRTGMMTNLANPDDTTALFHNPAGLADQPGLRLHASNGLTFMQTELSLKSLDAERFPEINARHCGDTGQPACDWPINRDGYYRDNIAPERYLGVIPYLGVSQDLGEWAPGLHNLVVSAAVYAPGAYGAYLPPNAPTSYYVIEGLFAIVSGTAGLGYRVNRHVAIGAKLSYNYMRLTFAQKFSTVDLLTPDGQAPDITAGLAQGALGDLRLDFTGSDHGAGGGLGILVTPFEGLAFGAAVEAATSARLEGRVTVRGLGSSLTGTRPVEPNELQRVASSVGFKLPERLVVEMPIPPAIQGGVSAAVNRHLELGIDARVWLYRVFKKQAMIPTYDDDAPGDEPLTAVNLSKDKHYHNSYELALGMLFKPWPQERDLDLMFGVGYDHSPVPNRTFSIDNPSLNQVLVTMGLRATLAERFRVGLGYMLINYLERNITHSETSPPTNVRVRGRAHIPTLEIEYLPPPGPAPASG